MTCSPERTTAAAVSSHEDSMPRMKVEDMLLYNNNEISVDLLVRIHIWPVRNG
jgi:hypothetical protein